MVNINRRIAGMTALGAMAVLACAAESEETETIRSEVVQRLAAFPYHTVPVNLVNANSGKCLDVAGGSKSNGALIQQYDCLSGVRNEEWWLLPVASSRYQIRSGHVGFCLNRKNGSILNNTVVQQQGCAEGLGAEADQWELNVLPDGKFEIRAPGTTQCLDIANASLANGGAAQMYTCIGEPNEKWTISPRIGTYYVTAKNNNKCMFADGLSNNDPVKSTECSNAQTRGRWRFEATGANFYIRSEFSNKCLDVPNASMAEVQLQQYDCIGVNNERWVIVEDGETDYVRIINLNSAKCLEESATGLFQKTCGSSNAQRWRIGFTMQRRVKQFAVAGTDGTGRRALADDVMQTMLTRLNTVYAPVGISLGYSEATDKIAIDDDALFFISTKAATTVRCAKNGQMMAPFDCATLRAADYPNDLVVIPNEQNFGGISGGEWRFVLLQYPSPDFTVCKFYDDQMAHEFGHYLGLNHTWGAQGVVNHLSKVLQSANNNVYRAFDGDRYGDTLPEPDVTTWDTCGETLATRSLTLSGSSGPVTMSVPLQNIMGYYHNKTKKLSPQQMGINRAIMRIRWF